jgi:hypothetical protein
MHAGYLFANDDASHAHGAEVRHHKGQAEDAYAGMPTGGLPTDGHSPDGANTAGFWPNVQWAVEVRNRLGLM